ncbi:MAG: hypothetical protein ACUVS4_00660 [Chloroflexaceae bacterium]
MRVKRNTTAHIIELSSVDVDLLQAIAQVIGGNYDYRKIRSDGECYGVEFCSKEMYYDLLALDGMPNNSNVIGFSSVPAAYLVHFVRGFVDGDGTLAWNGRRPVLQIYSGSKHLLEHMGMAIQTQTGFPAANVVLNQTLWFLKWRTIRAKCLAAWLCVDNPGLALDRKAAIVNAFINWQPRKNGPILAPSPRQ